MATSQIVHILDHLKPEKHLYEMGVESLKGYAASEKYLQRQTFCMMLEGLYTDEQAFNRNYKDTIDTLAKDNIDLVRISLAIAINNIIGAKNGSKSNFASVIS